MGLPANYANSLVQAALGGRVLPQFFQKPLAEFVEI